MSSSNDYILVTDSRNLDDESSSFDSKTKEEDEASSLYALEGNGVLILSDDKDPQSANTNNDPSASVEPLDRLAQELMDEGDIEIIQEDEEKDL